MPKILLWNFILLISFGLMACKKGQSEIENLRSLSGFSLNQTSINVASKSNPKFALSGKCTDQYHDIEMSFDGGEKWQSVSGIASSSNIDCSSNGTFSLEFNNDMSSWVPAGSVAANGLIRFRGVSEFGYSAIQDLSTLIRQTGHRFLAGSHSTTSGSYKLTGRVGGTLKISSGGFTLKGNLKAR